MRTDNEIIQAADDEIRSHADAASAAITSLYQACDADAIETLEIIDGLGETVKALVTVALTEKAAVKGLTHSNRKFQRMIQDAYEERNKALAKLNGAIERGSRASYDQGMRHGQLSAQSDANDEITALREQIKALTALLNERGDDPALVWTNADGARVGVE